MSATDETEEGPVELDFTVDDSDVSNLLESVAEVCRLFLQTRLKGEQTPELEVRQLSSATTNLGFRVRGGDALYFVRVFGSGTEVLYSRARERAVMAVASRHQIGPQLYATFANGIIAEFLLGLELETHEVRTPARSAQIAREVARWHKLDPKVLFDESTMELFAEHSFATLARWMAEAERLMAERPEEAPAAHWAPLWPELQREVASLTHTLLALLQGGEGEKEGPALVFSHNDLNPGNMMVRDEQLIFIDVETASLNFHPFDLGNFCNEWCGVLTTEWSHFPTEQQQRLFVAAYLEELHGAPPSQEQLDLLWCEVHYFSLFSNLFWCVWAVIQAFHSHIAHFSHLSYSKMRWSRYQMVKSTFDLLSPPCAE